MGKAVLDRLTKHLLQLSQEGYTVTQIVLGRSASEEVIGLPADLWHKLVRPEDEDCRIQNIPVIFSPVDYGKTEFFCLVEKNEDVKKTYEPEMCIENKCKYFCQGVFEGYGYCHLDEQEYNRNKTDICYFEDEITKCEDKIERLKYKQSQKIYKQGEFNGYK